MALRALIDRARVQPYPMWRSLRLLGIHAGLGLQGGTKKRKRVHLRNIPSDNKNMNDNKIFDTEFEMNTGAIFGDRNEI